MLSTLASSAKSCSTASPMKYRLVLTQHSGHVLKKIQLFLKTGFHNWRSSSGKWPVWLTEGQSFTGAELKGLNSLTWVTSASPFTSANTFKATPTSPIAGRSSTPVTGVLNYNLTTSWFSPVCSCSLTCDASFFQQFIWAHVLPLMFVSVSQHLHVMLMSFMPNLPVSLPCRCPASLHGEYMVFWI